MGWFHKKEEKTLQNKETRIKVDLETFNVDNFQILSYNFFERKGPTLLAWFSILHLVTKLKLPMWWIWRGRKMIFMTESPGYRGINTSAGSKPCHHVPYAISYS